MQLWPTIRDKHWNKYWRQQYEQARTARKITSRYGSAIVKPGGFLLTVGEGQANTPLVFVAIIMLSLIGIGAYFAVELLERRVLHYLPKSSN